MALPTASDNVFTRFLISEGGSTTTPAAGNVTIYAKADGLLYSKDDAGTEKLISSGPAAGIAAGTAFPGSPSTDDLFDRTDLNRIFRYDGTRWLSEQLFVAQYDYISNLSATTADANRAPFPGLMGGSDLWLEEVQLQAFNVAGGGSALSASHKWVITYRKLATGATTTFGTITIDSGASGAWRSATAVAVGALLNNGTVHALFTNSATKTGTPGNLYAYPTLTYRIVAT